MNKDLQKEAEAILKKHIDKESMDDVSENVWNDMIDAMIEYSQSQKQSERVSSDGVFFRCGNCNHEPSCDLLKMKFCPNCGCKFRNPKHT